MSFFPLVKNTELSSTLKEDKEETTSLPTAAREVIVMVLDFSSSDIDTLDQAGLEIINEIHKAIGEMEGIRNYSTLLNTPVVKAVDDEILVVPFIPEKLLTTYDSRKVASLKQVYHDSPEIKPYLSSDFRQCVFYLEPGKTYPNTRLIKTLENLKEKIAKEHHVTLDFTGLRPIRFFLEKLLTQDILVILPVLFIIISLLYIIVFRDIRILILSWSVKILATTAAFGCYMLFFKEISPLVIMIPVFNTGLLSDYLLHLFYHGREKSGPKTFYSARNYLAIPLSLTALTSIIGFSSLILFESGGHLLLAYTISISILFTYLLTIFFIPEFIETGFISFSTQKRAYGSCVKKIRRLLTLLFLVLYKIRIFIFLLIAILLILSICSLRNLKVQPYPLKQLPQKSTIIKAETLLNAKFSGTVPFMLEIDTGNVGSLLERKNLIMIDEIHHILSSDPDIGYLHSLLTIIKKIHFYFNNSDQDYFSIPDIKDEWDFRSLIEQYLLFFSASTSPEEYESLVDPDYRIASIKGILKYNDQESLTRFLSSFAAIKEKFPPQWSINFFGPLKELVQTTHNLQSNWIISLSLGSLLIFFTVLLFFREIKMSFLSLVPSLSIILIVTGIAPLLSIKIDEYTIIFIAITTGLTIDYTIHILNAIKKIKKNNEIKSLTGYAFRIIKSGGVPVFLSFLTSLISFAMLFLSSFSGAVHLAVMLTIAISWAFFIGGFILPMFFIPYPVRKQESLLKTKCLEKRI